MHAARIAILKDSWWLGIFVFAGLGVWAWILHDAWDNIHSILHGVTVTGRVVEVRASQVGRSRKSTHYEAVVEYEDASGTTHRFVPDAFAGRPERGPIAVRYDNEHTDDARLVGFAHNWALPLFAVPFAVVLVWAPLFMLKHEWRKAGPIAPGVPPPAGALGPRRRDGEPRPPPSDPEAVAKSIARQRRRRGAQGAGRA